MYPRYLQEAIKYADVEMKNVYGQSVSCPEFGEMSNVSESVSCEEFGEISTVSESVSCEEFGEISTVSESVSCQEFRESSCQVFDELFTSNPCLSPYVNELSTFEPCLSTFVNESSTSDPCFSSCDNELPELNFAETEALFNDLNDLF